MLFFKAIVPESCSGQLAKAASQSCCPKLLPESCNSSNIYPKTSPQSYSAKRLPKPPPRSCSCSPKLFVKLPPKLFFKATVPKVAPGCSPKRFEAASQSCSPKHLCKAAPKRLCFKPVPKAILQSTKAAPQSCSQSCSPKVAFKKVLPKAP